MERSHALEAHQDEKWFFCNTGRRLRKVRRSDKAGSAKVRQGSRRHATKVMFSGCVMNPDPKHGFDGKIRLARVCAPYVAKRTSKHHKKGDVYDKDCTMDAAYTSSGSSLKLWPRDASTVSLGPQDG